ncbi:MAG: DUF5946 family protein [Erythrobacter sp.]|uniref:DUF5946 family protein n=1 Tax=Erythrobacter sp. TaxID=1042 RepID=UPI0032984E12
MSETCFACGGQFAPISDGSTHAYMLSSPGCWAAYGELLAREYADPALFAAAHRLTVDAFAIQHPGDPKERRAVQSYWIHGASLWLVLREGQSHRQATQALKTLAGGDYPDRPLEPYPFAMTHADLLAAPVEQHAQLARDWAYESLEGWRGAHDEFARLAGVALGEKHRTS